MSAFKERQPKQGEENWQNSGMASTLRAQRWEEQRV